MPAINPARLRIQVTNLIEKFSLPKEFLADLHSMFDFYADRTLKPGRGGPRFANIKAYNVPTQVLRQIEGALSLEVSKDLDTALILVDELWAQKWLECRLLALSIIGQISASPPEPIIERITAWSAECGIDRKLDISLATGLIRLRKEAPNRFFQLLEGWLTSSNIAARKLGLRVIPPLVENQDFENLPAIFNLLSPIVETSSKVTDIDLIDALSALARRSPQETAYFLKQSLAKSDQVGLDALIRKVLNDFPTQLREELRIYFRQRRETLQK
jgi:hypothetical protein